MRMWANIPWDNEANLGRAYNDFMALIPDGDWAIFVDHDAMATTGKWHLQFQEAANALPDAGAIVAMTNRIASSWQKCGDPLSNDYAVHRKFGKERANIRTLLDVTPTKGWGGVAFAISKAAWVAAGGFPDGLGCVDHGWHFKMRDLGRKCWMHEGIVFYHWRHLGEPDPTSQHPKAANCPCRGAEPIPHQRIALP